LPTNTGRVVKASWEAPIENEGQQTRGRARVPWLRERPVRLGGEPSSLGIKTFLFLGKDKYYQTLKFAAGP
jgi:hypothetical protein